MMKTNDILKFDEFPYVERLQSDPDGEGMALAKPLERYKDPNATSSPRAPEDIHVMGVELTFGVSEIPVEAIAVVTVGGKIVERGDAIPADARVKIEIRSVDEHATAECPNECNLPVLVIASADPITVHYAHHKKT